MCQHTDHTNSNFTIMELLGYFTGLEIRQDQHGQAEYIMYHGTTFRNANNIIQNGFVRSTDGMLGPGVYVSRSFQKAAVYPIILPPGEVRVILRLRVRVGKVKRIDSQGHRFQKTWHQAGYDTAWVPPNCGMVPSGLEEDCVWDPRRIEVLQVLNNFGGILYPVVTTMALPYTFGPYPPSGPYTFGPYPPSGPYTFGPYAPSGPYTFGPYPPSGPYSFGPYPPSGPYTFGPYPPSGPYTFGPYPPSGPPGPFPPNV